MAAELEFTPPQQAELEKRAESFLREARKDLARLGLKETDVTPAARKVLETLFAAALIAQHNIDRGIDRRESIADTLAPLTEICETVPRRLDGLEARLAVLERGR